MKLTHKILYSFIINTILISFVLASPGNTKFQLGYDFYTFKMSNPNELIKLNDVNDNEDITLSFPAILGQLFGTPNTQLIPDILVNSGSKFTLSLPNDLKSISKPLSDHTLKVFPENTEITRLGTFFKRPSYSLNENGGAFVDKTTKELLMLVHFSNPTTLNGSLILRDDLYQHNVVIMRAGWNWLKLSQASKNKYLISAYEGRVENINFAIVE